MARRPSLSLTSSLPCQLHPSSSPCRLQPSSLPCRLHPSSSSLPCWLHPCSSSLSCGPHSSLLFCQPYSSFLCGPYLRLRPGRLLGFLFDRSSPGLSPRLHPGLLLGLFNCLSLPGSTLRLSVLIVLVLSVVVCQSCVVLYLCCHVPVMFLVFFLRDARWQKGGGGGGLYCVSNKETHFLASDNNHLNYETLNL